MTHKELLSVLSYDKCTGKFFWNTNKDKNNRRKMLNGTEAGCKNLHGYIVIRVFGRLYMAHRLAWFYVYKKWPNKNIDHINHNGNDNRISNLRDVDQKQNGKNIKKKKNNKSGYTGVSFSTERRKWVASIYVNGITHALGRYNCITYAYIKRLIAENKYNFHKNHGK